MAAPDLHANRKLAAALALAAAGLHVFPVRVRIDGDEKKLFPVLQWQRVATTDPVKVTSWWADGQSWASASIGVATGPSGLAVVDPDGLEGLAEWKAIRDLYGLSDDVPRYSTPGGGEHWWYRTDPARPLPTLAKTISEHVDTRGGYGPDGSGFVIVPPSTDERGAYAWITDAPSSLAALPAVPEAVYAVIEDRAGPKPGERQPSGAVHDPSNRRFTRDQANEYIKPRFDALKTGSKGGRNTALNNAARMMAHFIPDFITEPDARTRLRTAALRTGLDMIEVEKTIESAFVAEERDRESGQVDREGRPLGWRATLVTDAEPAEPEQSHGGLSRFLLPREIWGFTPTLEHVYAAAMARICSPDAVLHCVLAIIASYLHHETRVHTGKRPSVLNYDVAPIAYSGGGKSEALACARELLADWTNGRFAIRGHLGQDYVDAPMGSGEGLIEAFMGDVMHDLKDAEGQPVLDKEGKPRSVKVREQARHNALFHADEGRQALAIDSRKGSTLLAVICELWSGAITGQTNAERDRCRKLDRGYAAALVMNFQPETIDPLFEDQAGGAPQRFVFTSAEYAPHADDLDAPEAPWPGGLDLKINPGPVQVKLGEEQRAIVRRHIRARAGGRADDGLLDGHRMLLRCRLAALLTLLMGDTVGQAEIDAPVQMWELAGTILDRSCELRDWLAGMGERRRASQAQANDERARIRAVATEREKAADAEKRERERIGRVAAVIARRVAALNAEVPHRTLRDAASRYRRWLDEAICEAVEFGWIERSGKHFRPGPKVGDIPPA